MAAANLKDIKRRMKSVESTMQITKAMELVASSKLRRAKEKADKSAPYFNTLYETMSEIVSESEDFRSIFTQKQSGATLLIVIAGDRGLAGGFNANVFKLAQSRIAELQAGGDEVILMSVGKKSVEHFAKQQLRVMAQFEAVGEDLTVYQALGMAEQIVSFYESGKIGRVELVYTSYISPLVQEAQFMKVIPVANMERDPSVLSLTNYEPSPEEVFDGLIPQYLAGMLFGAIVESFASEQAARRMAMENATDNAGDMIANLSLVYNRARQAAITQEITEIVGGANAQS